MHYISFPLIIVLFLFSMTTPYGFLTFSFAVFSFILGVIVLFVEGVPNAFKNWNRDGSEYEVYDVIKFVFALIVAGIILFIGRLIMINYPQQI